MSMVVTVGLITLTGVALLGLPWGAAILLGAILAPTDPVLASDVQVSEPTDRDRLRFSLTGEAGFNDGTAFPFVMLGLGVMGLRDLGPLGWRWLAVDVVWAIGGGIAIGWLAGRMVGKLVLFLRRRHKEAVGLDDFLSLGLLALTYGGAVAAHAYGFLAVFAAGLALGQIEADTQSNEATSPEKANPPPPPDVVETADASKKEGIATDPETAHAYMAQAVLGFNEQLERIAEVAMVILLGGMLIVPGWLDVLWFVPVLLLVIRPLSVWAGTVGTRATTLQRSLIGWFGIRGIGSIYYLTYAIAHGLDERTAGRLTGVTFVVVAASITLHGISVTPLMNRYGKAMKARRLSRAPSGVVQEEEVVAGSP
jgi:NhaP-type Na+/H+ or K+/H+ antiporter